MKNLSNLLIARGPVSRWVVGALMMLPLFMTGCQDPPEACFAVDATVVDQNFPVLFSNCSVFQQQGYSWDFGDGTTSTATSPVHRFSEQGEYLVALTSLANNSVNDDTYSEIIKVAQRRFGTLLVQGLPEDNNGTPWDAASNPDVKVTFTNQATTTLEYTTAIQPDFNVNNDLSISGAGANFELKPATYLIEVFDDDSGSEELMASFTINLDDFIPDETQSFNLSDGGSSLGITYELF